MALGSLFGGSDATPKALPPSPKIGDAVGESAARENRYRLRRRRGSEDTILGGSGLGDAPSYSMGGGGGGRRAMRSTLGGG